MTIGSCFSDNIGKRLIDHGFDTSSNPFSTIFNPISIAKLISMTLKGKSIDDAEVSRSHGRSFHYDFHSSFDSSDPAKVKQSINEVLLSAHSFMKGMEFMIITLGTSIVYKKKEDKTIVSNCHKMPSQLFSKELLSEDSMLKDLELALGGLWKNNPKRIIILTVSPVRHIKEGVVQNSLSKSRLISLCHTLCEKYPLLSYFPAFEIMMDELRDYRFYESDLIHPNQQAIDIIWSRFMDSYFDETAKEKVVAFKALNAAANHKPFDSTSENHQKFITNQLDNLAQLSRIYPEYDFSSYKTLFESQWITS